MQRLVQVVEDNRRTNPDYKKTTLKQYETRQNCNIDFQQKLSCDWIAVLLEIAMQSATQHVNF
jgi:hypothetical protein